MTWIVPRFLAGLLAFAAGAVMARQFFGEAAALSAGLTTAVLTFVVLLGVDSLRGRRLVAWLRDRREDTAPRDTGFWGDLGQRVERTVRALETKADAERTRLTQFVLAMEASPNGVLLLDAGDHIEWCNARAADHFDLDQERDVHQRMTNLVRSPVFVAYLQAGIFAAPVVFPDPRGRGSIQVTVRPYGADSKLVISEDLTARDRAEAMRRDFVANVSHEMRTPLTVLSGFLETMRNLPLSEVERKRVITLMTQQAERMTNLVGDLLTLAQLEGNPRPPADTWLRLDLLLAQVEAGARALSAGRHTMTFDAVPHVQVAGNETELQSAIANLVTNAVRYTPEGGEVSVGWNALGNGGGEIAVTDTGRGVAREHLSRLTERFYRVDGGRSRESGGTGLGLAIVKHVIQRHGGELQIASEPGKGSTFRLCLPATRLRHALDAGAASEAAAESAPPDD